VSYNSCPSFQTGVYHNRWSACHKSIRTASDSDRIIFFHSLILLIWLCERRRAKTQSQLNNRKWRMIRSLPLPVLIRSPCGTSGGYYECAQGDLAGHLRVWLKWQHDVMNTRAGCIEEGVISLVMLFGNEGTER